MEFPERHEGFEVLRFIRDAPPTESELLEYLGGEPVEARERYGDLMRSGMIVFGGNRWMLKPGHLSEDGRCFTWDNVVIWLDEERYLIKPKVTWLPEDWESTLGIVGVVYFFFYIGCLTAFMNFSVSLWIRWIIVGLYCALFGVDFYIDVISREWTRLQKWQLFAQRTIMGLLLSAPMYFLSHVDW